MATSGIEWSQFVVHPLAFALMSSYSMSDSVTTDLIIYKTCQTIPGINISQCDLIHTNSSSEGAMSIEKQVQPYTANIFMLKSCIETILPSLMSLFLGPWSDKYGRKPLLLFPFSGHLMYYLLLSTICNWNLNSYWLLLPSVPTALLGGFPAIMIACICYITDVTSSENRAWNLACMDTTYSGGMLLGILLSPVLFREYGYEAVFLASTFICLFAILYTFICVKETVKNENRQNLSSVFDISLVKDLFGSVLKKREGFDRFLVCSCIIVIALNVVIMLGNGTVAYLFTSSTLGWNISDYSNYFATVLLISVFGMQFIIKFVGSFLRLPETVIVVLACLSSSAGNLVRAFAKKPWHMYLSAGVAMFSPSAVPVVRAIMSKTVPQKDLGKVFSITAVMEMVLPFATTPIYIYVYSHTLQLFPSPVWFISAVLPLVMIIFTIIIQRRWRILKETQYSQLSTNDN